MRTGKWLSLGQRTLSSSETRGKGRASDHITLEEAYTAPWRQTEWMAPKKQKKDMHDAYDDFFLFTYELIEVVK